MNSHYTYLLINFLTVLFPVLLSFDKKVQFYKSWKYILPGLIISGFFFLLWDYIFTVYSVWSFNPMYVTGYYILNLPVEEILFFITVPFACIFIYECLNHYVRKDLLGKSARLISLFLILFSVFMLILFYQRVYSLITFGLLLLMSSYTYIRNPVYMGRFYVAYIVSLLPFYLVNGLLTSLPVVSYNDLQNSAIRIGTIPLEDHFYSLAMLLLNIILFEYFRSRKTLK